MKLLLYSIFVFFSFCNVAIGATLTEYYNTGDDSYTDVYYARAQTFTASDEDVEYIKVLIYRSGGTCTGNVVVDLRPTAGGVPSNNAGVLGSASLDCSTISGTPTWYQFDFSPVVSLSDSTVYAVVVESPQTSRIYIQYDSNSAYSGQMYYSLDSGDSWSSNGANLDFMFEIYKQDAVPESSSSWLNGAYATATVSDTKDLSIVVGLQFLALFIGFYFTIWQSLCHTTTIHQLFNNSRTSKRPKRTKQKTNNYYYS